MAENGGRPDGFEYDGTFYRWHVTDKGKDLLLIDRIANMAPHDFFAMIEDRFDLDRAPVTLTLIATSIRAEHPEWSLERIVGLVGEMSLGDVDFVFREEEERTDIDGPPALAGPTPATSDSPADESSSSPTLREFSASATSSEIPPSSGPPGSDTSTE